MALNMQAAKAQLEENMRRCVEMWWMSQRMHAEIVRQMEMERAMWEDAISDFGDQPLTDDHRHPQSGF